MVVCDRVIGKGVKLFGSRVVLFSTPMVRVNSPVAGFRPISGAPIFEA